MAKYKQKKARPSAAFLRTGASGANDAASTMGFVTWMISLLICMVFFAYDAENVTANAIGVTVAFVIVIVTFFSSVTVGLLLNIACIFAYASYLIVMVLTSGAQVGVNSYFFIVISPLLTVSSGAIFRRGARLEAENAELRRRMQETLVDAESGMHTMNALEHDLEAYRSIARRFDLKIMLVVWVYRFPMELRRLLGENGMEEAGKNLMLEARRAFRREDLLYLLSENRWAALTIGSEPDEKAVKKRIKALLDGRFFAGEDAPRIELRFGIAEDAMNENGEYITPAELLERAEMSAEYDV